MTHDEFGFHLSLVPSRFGSIRIGRGWSVSMETVPIVSNDVVLCLQDPSSFHTLLALTLISSHISTPQNEDGHARWEAGKLDSYSDTLSAGSWRIHVWAIWNLQDGSESRRHFLLLYDVSNVFGLGMLGKNCMCAVWAVSCDAWVTGDRTTQ